MISPRTGQTLRIVPIIAVVVGFSAIALLVAYLGAGAVIQPLLAIGWSGFFILCLLQLALIVAMGVAWRALVPELPLWIFPWGRLMRDAGSEVLPLSQMGGCILG